MKTKFIFAFSFALIVFNSPLPLQGMYKAVEERNTDMIKALLAHGVHPDSSSSQATPLAKAARQDYLLAVQLLLAAGADPNKKDANGQTALDYALSNGQYEKEIFETLLENGANPNSQDNGGNTVLMTCVIGSIIHRGRLKVLMKHRADPFIKDCTGKSALDYAHNRPDILDILMGKE